MEPTPPERRAGVARSVLTGIAMGLREVFDPEKRDTIVIEQDAPADPLEPQKVEVHLDTDDPRDSTAIYRPWLEESGTAPGSALSPTGPNAANHSDDGPDHGSPGRHPEQLQPERPQPEPPAPEPPQRDSDPMFGFGF